MTEDTALDTNIRSPSMTAGEVEMLLLAMHRPPLHRCEPNA